MKILFNTYPMAFHTPGGGEMQLMTYKKYLEKKGVTVGLFDLWNPNFLNFDMVHFFSVMGGSIRFCHFVKSLSLPLVITSSLWPTRETKHLYPSDEIERMLFLADRVITNSHLESIQLADVYGVAIEKCSVVYNGVDPLFFEKVSPTLFREHFKIDYPFVLNVANVETRKNQLNLIRALKKIPSLKLVVIGHIREEAYAKDCFAEAGDQLVFLGPISHHDPLLRSAYAACDLFALPSTLETPGLAALEAAASGARVVVTGIGAPREYFGEQVIYTDRPDNINDIADRVQEALETKNAVGSAKLSQTIQEQFSWDKVIGNLHVAYYDLL